MRAELKITFPGGGTLEVGYPDIEEARTVVRLLRAGRYKVELTEQKRVTVDLEDDR